MELINVSTILSEGEFPDSITDTNATTTGNKNGTYSYGGLLHDNNKTCRRCKNYVGESPDPNSLNVIYTVNVEQPKSCAACCKVTKTDHPYICLVCSKAFHQKSNLERHMHVHTGEKPYVCELCKKAFSQAIHLKRHTATREMRPYACHDCCKSFLLETELAQHKLYHAGEKRRYSCTVCTRTFFKSSHLKQHEQSHATKQFVCSICQKSLIRKSSLFQHMLGHASIITNSCITCSLSFQAPEELKTHLRVEHTLDKQLGTPVQLSETKSKTSKSTQFRCDKHKKPALFTQSIIVTPPSLSNNKGNQPQVSNEQRHSIIPQSETCSNSNWISHVNNVGQFWSTVVRKSEPKCDGNSTIHTDVGDIEVIIYSCPQDAESKPPETAQTAEDTVTSQKLDVQDMSQPIINNDHDRNDEFPIYPSDIILNPVNEDDDMNINIPNIHEKDNPKIFRCTTCYRIFTRKYCLKKHMQTHTGDRPHACVECGKKFTQHQHLTQHMMIHRKDKPYPCSQCHKTFGRSSHLRLHMLIHTGQQRARPHKCTICNHRFVQRARLQDHMNVHTGEHPYLCTLCHRRFTHKSYLAQHRLVHAGNKTYMCSICRKAFITSSSLGKHMVIHSDTRPHACLECGRAFKQSSNLVKHMAIHNNVKTHACVVPECQKAFRRSEALKKHMKIHSRNQLHIGEVPKENTSHKL